MNEKKVEIYLNYLDKEMTIMGILSTFAIAVPAFVLERAFSAGSGFFYDLRTLGQNYLLTGSALMLLAAAAFYKQRSQLAWYYGQIALDIALARPVLEDRLKDADSWSTWLPYNFGLAILFLAFLQYLFAVLSALRHGQSYLLISVILSVVTLIVCFLNLYVLARFNDKDDPWNSFRQQFRLHR